MKSILPAADELVLSDRLFGGEDEEFKGVIPRFVQLAPREPAREMRSIVTNKILSRNKLCNFVELTASVARECRNI